MDPAHANYGGKERSGPNYRQLKPEVKQCIDKLVYQIDLCRNTLQLLETRIGANEKCMAEVVDYIQSEDINYKPLISRAVIKTEAGDSELKKTAYDDIELSNSIGANNLTKIR